MNPKEIVRNAFRELLDERGFEQAAPRWFSLDYVQSADGKSLDFEGFVAHLAALRGAVSEIHTEFQEMIAEGDVVATRHVVTARKDDGTESRHQLIAFFEVRDGKICRCDELTHQLSGRRSDRDLGTRA